MFGRLPLVLALAVGLAPSAFAHAFLERAVPAAGSTVAAAPASLRLRYTEAVVPHFCIVQVLDAGGHPVAAGPPRAVEDNRTLLVDLPNLAPGTYTVVWHVTAEDTHKTEGRFRFSIAP
ncbi:MAG TPA: copper resistance CopC family protein [Solirubrobacteraceae bacterium]